MITAIMLKIWSNGYEKGTDVNGLFVTFVLGSIIQTVIFDICLAKIAISVAF